MVTAPVSNIQRYSTKDGPGIRTTLFLSGCSLNCAWCSNPELIPVFKFYDYHLARLQHLADRLGYLAKQLYEEYSQDRSAVAKVIQKHPLAWVGFRCIESDRKGSEFLMQIPLDRICKMIPEYQEEDLSALFRETQKEGIS